MNEVHLEIPVCPEGIFFDDAVEALSNFTKGTDISKITSLKCHTNTWGLSSNNWFADEIVANMKSLTKFDLSDTVNYRHRSDLCMGIKSILMAAVTNNIEYIDLSDNFLDMDGGRAFAAFLAENKSL
jgi:Ran GTPase-activating protein (RanGAP) involved in mRNA processing and transport